MTWGVFLKFAGFPLVGVAAREIIPWAFMALVRALVLDRIMAVSKACVDVADVSPEARLAMAFDRVLMPTNAVGPVYRTEHPEPQRFRYVEAEPYEAAPMAMFALCARLAYLLTDVSGNREEIRDGYRLLASEERTMENNLSGVTALLARIQKRRLVLVNI